MLNNYFKIAWRNLIKNKGYSAINIGGLAVGMAVAILIGLWIWDELSYNKYHKNYDRIVRVMQNQNFNGEIGTQVSNPYVLAAEIRNKYGSDFKYVLQSSWNNQHTLTYGDKKLLKNGSYFEPEVAEMLSLKMIKGSRNGLKEPYSILLSASVAETYFGNEDPMNKTMKLDNEVDVKVLTPVSVPILQLLCLPLPFIPANGFSCNKTFNLCLLATRLITSMSRVL